MKLACVLIPHLSTLVELRQHPHLKKKPFVIADRSRGLPIVVDFLPDGVGLKHGISLEQAMSLHEGVGIPEVLESDESHYRRVFDGVLSALQGVSDRVEAAELGTAYVGIDGLEGMYGGEARLARALLNAVPPDLQPASGAGPRQVPRIHGRQEKHAPQGSPNVPANVKSFLAPHQHRTCSPSPPKLKDEIHRLGLHRMGYVASLAMRRFCGQVRPRGSEGVGVVQRHGSEAPSCRWPFEEAVVERTSLPFHTSSIEALLVALDTLMKRAYARPDMKGRCAGSGGYFLRSRRMAPLGKKNQVQISRRIVAEGFLRPEKPVGDGPANPTRGGGVPHPVKLHPRIWNPDGDAQELPGRPARAAGGGGQKAETPHGRRPCPAHHSPGGPLASGPGDAGPAGARGPVGQRRHKASSDATARGGEDGRRRRAGVGVAGPARTGGGWPA